MYGIDGRKWLEGAFPDDEEQYRCHIFDAIGALFALGPEIFGGAAAAGEAGAAGIGAAEAGIGAGVAGADAFAGGTAALDALTGSLVGGAGAAGLAADTALPALGLAADTALPELTAGAAEFGGGGLVGVAGGGAAGLDAASLAAGGGAGLIGGGGDIAGAGLSAAAPGASSLTGVAPLGAATVAPAAAAPPAEFLAASSLDPAAGAAGGEAGGAAASSGSLSGPVTGGELPMTFEAGPGTTVNSFDPATGATTASGAGTPAGSILNKLGLGGVSDFMSENKGLMTLGAAGLPLASMLLRPTPTFPGVNALKGTAAGLTQQGNNLTSTGSALQSESMAGVLPSGFEDAIREAKNAAMTRVGNQYGNLGLSGSTSEAVDRANVAASVDAQRAPILQELMSKGLAASGAGVNALGAAGNQDLELAKIQIMQDQELQKALQSLASNLVLSSMPARTINIT